MTKAKRARIQDVAKLAGVSTMTVSRVLGKEIRVSEDKKVKVLAAVKELNYRPNASARRLASNKSFFIGLLYFDLPASYVSQFLIGALKSCRVSGYHLVVDEVDDNIDKSLASIEDLINVTQVDGMILLPPVSDNQLVIDFLQNNNIPFVRIAPETQLTIAPYVCIDDYHGGYTATEKLIELGHRKIAHIIGHTNQGGSRLRYQGYLDALRSHQLTVPPEYIVQGYYDYQSGLDAAKKLFALDDLPTAIFAANDEMAAGALAAAHVSHINVPEELSIVGFDDAQLAVTISPNLSTIRQPIDEMAKLALEILTSGKFKNLEKVSTGDFRHVLDFEYIGRDSTKNIN